MQYRRVLLKLSGEALMGSGDFGIDPAVLGRVADEVVELVTAGVQVGVVIGGGNIFRGAGLAQGGFDRVTADQMGMLATVMNALAMGQALDKRGQPAVVLSAIPVPGVCEHYSKPQAVSYLQAGRVVLFAAGTGNPYFTTDSAASLRAVEIGADLLIKATKVNGVYAADPVRYPDAERFAHISYDEVISQRLGVMDATAIILCRDNRLPLRVVDMTREKSFLRAAMGEDEGTLVHGNEQ